MPLGHNIATSLHELIPWKNVVFQLSNLKIIILSSKQEKKKEIIVCDIVLVKICHLKTYLPKIILPNFIAIPRG